MKLKESFHPYAATTIICWSLAYVFTRMALNYFSAFSLGFLRYAAASIVLAAAAFLMKMRLPRKKDLLWFVLSGAAGFFLYIITFNKGCETITAATSSLIIATVPVLTALFARITFKEKLHWTQWAATGIEFAGVAVLTVLSGGFSANIGLLWLLTAAVLLSVYNLVQRVLTRTYSAFTASAFSIFAGTVMLTIFLPQSAVQLKSAQLPQILYILILGVFSSAVAYWTWSVAISKAKHTSSVSNYMFLTPFLTGILGIAISKESITLPTIAGGAIILFGLLIFNFGKRVFDESGLHKSSYKNSHKN